MLNGNERYLFDTSTILPAWEGEAGAQEVRNLLQQATLGACEVYLSFMTIFEAYYITKRKNGTDRANEIYRYLHSFPLSPIGMEEDILILSGDLKVKYSLGVGDAWIAATAISRTAILVYRDPDFDKVQEVSKLRIPR